MNERKKAMRRIVVEVNGGSLRDAFRKIEEIRENEEMEKMARLETFMEGVIDWYQFRNPNQYDYQWLYETCKNLPENDAEALIKDKYI